MTGAEIDRITVIGAGRMGHGIALAYALAGRDVTLYDVDEGVLESSLTRIESILDTLHGEGHISGAEGVETSAHITLSDDFGAAVSDADFVTEAVTEDIEIKQTVFESLDEHASESAILATNTSGLSIDDIAGPVENETRVLGTHWFNPPYIVPLVEIIMGSETSEESVRRTQDLLEAADKTPVVVRKDLPGFIGNRIQAAMSYEAFSLLARGVATPADIDKAVKAGFGFRLPVMGIFEKMDQSGLDIHHEVEKQLMDDLDRGVEPNPVIRELLERGETGIDAGKGVYDWTEVDLDEIREARDCALLAMLDLYESGDGPSAPSANYDRT